MEQDKYFTPSIEDIRVGYECEISPTKAELWKSLIWAKEDFNKYITFRLRVPFLTKEQIEAEGWKKEQMWFERNNMVLFYNTDTKQLGIIEKDPSISVRLHSPLFRGSCKDINTFRYICKLLGI